MKIITVEVVQDNSAQWVANRINEIIAQRAAQGQRVADIRFTASTISTDDGGGDWYTALLLIEDTHKEQPS